MKRYYLVEKLKTIFEFEEMDAERYIKRRPLEMGVLWFKDECLMFFQEPIAWVSSIQDIGYYGKRDVKENVGVHIVFYVRGYTAHIILSDDEANCKLWVNEVDSSDSLEGKEFIQEKLGEQRLRNWIACGLEEAWFDWKNVEKHKQILLRETEEYMEKHPDDKDIKYAYLDLFFINKEYCCSERYINDWIAEEMSAYAVHFENEVWDYCKGSMYEEDINELVDEVYAYLKSKEIK